MTIAFMLIGGLGLFFFGMQSMSEGLKNIAGERLKNILHMVTKLPVIGIIVGAVVTCFIQSSSATTVMVVGFVNAGLLGLKQAISVVMGANIGTTFTAWLVSSMAVFKITNYALPAIGIGFAIKSFGRTKNARFWGQALLGFGLLFLGLAFMKDAFDPLKDSQQVKDLFATFGRNPFLGVFVGMVITMLIQSSSATIAIVQVMAFNGIISFPTAIALMLGDDIGTTITAQLSAVGTNLSARRTAMSHTLFNVIGVSYFMIFVYNGWFVKAVDFIIPGKITLKNVMFHIAIANSAFKIINAAVFLPFIGLLEKMSIWLVPKKKGAIDLGPQYLEKHLLNTPPIALEQARNETVWMMNLASKSVTASMRSFLEGNISITKPVENLERAIDNLQSEITRYLVELSQRRLTAEEAEELPVLIHNVNDIERIGDHSENIVELTERRIEKKLVLTDEALNELTLMWNELNSMMIETQEALKGRDSEKAESVIMREQKINHPQTSLKKSHVNRLNEGGYDLKAGIVFMDMVDNMEKIGDHLTNIAQGIIGGMRWTYKDDLRVSKTQST